MNKHYFYKRYRRIRRGVSIIAVLALFLCLYIFVSKHLETRNSKPTEVAACSTPPVVEKDDSYKRNNIGFDIEEKVVPKPSTESKQSIETTNLGKFKISAYCHCVQCCGKSDGITATGTTVQTNRTIAVDPRVIPLGSKVLIDGQEYVAEDTGGAIKGNRIDMYFSTHQEALNFGIQYKDITIVKES